MTEWPDIAIVIVTWNSANWIGQCLQALARTRYYGRMEIIVVDNASSDSSGAIVQDFIANGSASASCRLIRNPENMGFGGANNIGWRATQAPVIVFLNPDTETRPDWLAPILERFESSTDTAIIGSKLLYPLPAQAQDNQANPQTPLPVIQHAGGIIYDNGMTDHHGAGQEDRGQCDRPREVDYITGAAMAVRRSFLEQTSGFDDLFYPAYFEETDLCAQAHARGMKVVYEPRSVIVHHESTSVTRGSRRFMRLYADGRVKFLAKHYSAADWLCRFLPFELRWFRWRQSRAEYASVLRSYAGAFMKIIRKQTKHS